MAKQDNHTFLTTGKISKVIPTLAVPTIISMLVTSIYNIVDTYFVGQLNTQATAAVGIVFPIMSIIQAIGFFFGQGSGTYISRQLGAKEKLSAQIMASTSFFEALIFGILVTITGLIFLNPLSILLGSTPTILPYTKSYMGVILLGAPFMTCAMVLNNQMRFQGNANKSMYGMMTGAVLNVILVPICMFVFDLGVLGAALGTVISQVFSFIVLLIMSQKGENIRINPKYFSLQKTYFFEILKGGTPSLTRQGLASISTLMLNIAATTYGDVAIAAMSIVSRISFVVFAVILGIGQGFQPFCGFNYGAGYFERVKKGYFFAIKISISFLLVCCVIGFCFASDIMKVLRDDASVIAIGTIAFRWQIITYPLSAVVTMTNMMLQTSGKTIPANILAAARNGIFFIPLILILPRLFGLFGVEICQALADMLSFVLALPLAYNYFKNLKC